MEGKIEIGNDGGHAVSMVIDDRVVTATQRHLVDLQKQSIKDGKQDDVIVYSSALLNLEQREYESIKSYILSAVSRRAVKINIIWG